MGEFLSKPNTDKHSDDGENAFVNNIKYHNNLFQKYS